MTIILPIVGDSDGVWGTILNDALTDLDNRVTANTAASGSIGGLEGDVNALDAQVTTLTGQVTGLAGQVSSLTTRVTNLENAGATGGLIVGTTATLPAVTVGQITLATDTGYLSYGASIAGVATRVPWPGSYLGQFRQTSAQNLPVGSAGAALNMNAKDSDRLNAFTGSRYTCPVRGMYEFVGAVSFANDTTGYRSACWAVDGALLTATRITVPPAAGGVATVIPVRTKPMSLSVGQYVELYAFQNSSGGVLATEVANLTQQPMFNVKYLGYNGS